jgi:hypothetical protein
MTDYEKDICCTHLHLSYRCSFLCKPPDKYQSEKRSKKGTAGKEGKKRLQTYLSFQHLRIAAFCFSNSGMRVIARSMKLFV